jgi:hypothetical protein
LLHNRSGILAALRRLIASTAFGVGVDPICRLPEISMRRALIKGLLAMVAGGQGQGRIGRGEGEG